MIGVENNEDDCATDEINYGDTWLEDGAWSYNAMCISVEFIDEIRASIHV